LRSGRRVGAVRAGPGR